uniref:Uncharacterized protein n=1 Tax=Ciona intestinalis TaxID=7719 RepID=F6QRF4_CIOIN
YIVVVLIILAVIIWLLYVGCIRDSNVIRNFDGNVAERSSLLKKNERKEFPTKNRNYSNLDQEIQAKMKHTA